MGYVNVDSTTVLEKDKFIDSSFETQIIDVQQIEGYSFQIVWKNANAPVVGGIEIHCSNDQLGEFVKVDGSTTKVRDSEGSVVYNVLDFHYRYMKLVITMTSGDGEFDIVFNSRSRRV